MRRSTSIWLVVFAVGLSSLFAASYQLWSLPELPIYLGPELKVRSVTSTFPGWEGASDLQRGDRVDAVEGQSVDTLADVRAILRGLPTAHGRNGEIPSKQKKADTNKQKGDASANGPQRRVIDVQVRRPLHRFTISLQREDANSGELPPGYNPATDRLLEINGHALPEPLGPEQVRSIIATSSQALLTFGRRGAIFQADVPVGSTGFPWIPGVLFALALGAAAMIWRRHAQEHDAEVAAAIGLETIAVGWIALLAFAYQWILADRVLATVIIASMCLVRPFAMFARSRGPTRESTEGLWSLGIGAGFAMLLAFLFNMGPLSRVEVGLFAAASVGALAVVYEMTVLGFDEGAPSTLAEGGGYLVAVLVAGFICAFLAWLFDPTLFEEQLWRWFAVGMVGLVWFGDVMFTLRGPLSSTYGNVVSVQDRRDKVTSYLRDVSERLPETAVQLMVRQDGRSVTMRLERGGLAIEEPDENLSDAIDILVQEDSRIPLPESQDKSNHPLTGIALSMDIVLAMQMHPPEFGLILPDTDIVLIAYEESSAGDVPSYASDEVIDFVQARLDAATWVGVYVEGIRGLSKTDPVSPATVSVSRGADASVESNSDGEVAETESSDKTEGPDDNVQERIEKLEAENQRLEETLAEERASNENLRADRRELASRLQDHQRRWRALSPPVDRREDLLEEDLRESMSYLVEDKDPVVLGGPYAGGKRYVACCLADLDGIAPEMVVNYDAGWHAPDEHAAFLFAEDDDSGDKRDDVGDPMQQNFVGAARDGLLVISSAGLLSDSVILTLCDRAEASEFRLILCFHDAEAHERSVLEDRSSKVVNRLGHRELVIPSVDRRPTILASVFEFYLERYANRLGRSVPSLSTDAFDWLSALSYPAQMREVQLWMHRIVLKVGDETVEPNDLPEPIRPPDQKDSES